MASNDEKDKKIAELEQRLELYEKSDYKKAYTTIKKQIDQWLDEMNSSPLKLKNTSDKDNKQFEKALSFIKNVDDLFGKLDWLRKKMNGEAEVNNSTPNKKSKKQTGDMIPMGQY